MSESTDKKYSLTPDGSGRWLDQDGCSWGSAEDWFFINILGGCGCGDITFPERAVDLLRYFGLAG